MRVDGAGRTDAGVHATRPGHRLHLSRGLPVRELARGARGDSCRRTSPSMRSAARSSRASARAIAARYREYRYTVWNGPRSPLRERTALGVREPLDVAAMAEAAQALVGRHDFSAFGGGRSTTDPDRSRDPGPQAGPDDHHRRGRRRLPAPDGSQHRGRAPPSRPRGAATKDRGRGGARVATTGVRRRRRPAPGARACDGSVPRTTTPTTRNGR